MMMHPSDFVQTLLRDRQMGGDLMSSSSSIVFDADDFVVVSDNARVFANAVPKEGISHLQRSSSTSSSSSSDSNSSKGEDRWATPVATTANNNSAPGASTQTSKDRWESNSDSVLTMPQRKFVSPYKNVSSAAYRPKFDVSVLDLTPVFALTEDDDSVFSIASDETSGDGDGEGEIEEVAALLSEDRFR